MAFLLGHLPETLDNRDELAYRLCPKALNGIPGVKALRGTW